LGGLAVAGFAVQIDEQTLPKAELLAVNVQKVVGPAVVGDAVG
jgi:hypothetical protein